MIGFASLLQVSLQPVQRADDDTNNGGSAKSVKEVTPSTLHLPSGKKIVVPPDVIADGKRDKKTPVTVGVPIVVGSVSPNKAFCQRAPQLRAGMKKIVPSQVPAEVDVALASALSQSLSTKIVNAGSKVARATTKETGGEEGEGESRGRRRY